MLVISLILVAGAQFGAPRLDLWLPTSLPSSTAWVVVEKVMEADSSSNHSKLCWWSDREYQRFSTRFGFWIGKGCTIGGRTLSEGLSVVPQEAGTFRPTMFTAWQGDSCGRSISGDVAVAGCGLGCSGHPLIHSPTLLSLTRSLAVFAKTCPFSQAPILRKKFSPVVCFGASHPALHQEDLAQLDVEYRWVMCMVVGPPANTN